jgi:hypothetical protein
VCVCVCVCVCKHIIHACMHACIHNGCYVDISGSFNGGPANMHGGRASSAVPELDYSRFRYVVENAAPLFFAAQT